MFFRDYLHLLILDVAMAQHTHIDMFIITIMSQEVNVSCQLALILLKGLEPTIAEKTQETMHRKPSEYFT
jgi:hypothetical protein